MEQNIQKIGIVNWFILLVVGLVSAVLARYAGTAAGTVGIVFLALGFLIAAVSYFQMRLEERERLEKLEFDELKKARSGAALFQSEGDTFPARRSREQFEKCGRAFSGRASLRHYRDIRVGEIDVNGRGPPAGGEGRAEKETWRAA